MLTFYIEKLFVSVRKASLYSTKSKSTELQQVVHTAEGVVHIIPVLTPEFTSATVDSSPRSYSFTFAGS